MNNIINISLILERLKQYLNIKTDTELSNILQVKQSTLSSWKNRNTIDINEIYSYSVKFKVNLHWLLTGEGNPNIKDNLENTIKYKERIEELEEELKKTVKGTSKNNIEIARLQNEITELRAKLDYADNLIKSILKA